MKVACFSISGEQLTLNNIARPNDWKFFEHLDWVGMAMYEPDIVYVGGWFVANYADWQVHRAMIGRAKKVVIQWFGSDVGYCKGFYDQGQREMFRQLNSDRFVNIPPTDIIKGEMERWLELDCTEPLNTPAEELILPHSLPKSRLDSPQVAIYMPPGRQDFFRLPLIKEAIPKIKARCFFYHWIPETQRVGVQMGPSESDFWEPPHRSYGHDREEYMRIIADSTCALRIPVHDAWSITAAEFLMAGKPVVSDRDMPKYKRLIRGEVSVDRVVRAVNKALRYNTVDRAVSDFCRDRWNPLRYAERVAERCKTRWEGFDFGREHIHIRSQEVQAARLVGSDPELVEGTPAAVGEESACSVP